MRRTRARDAVLAALVLAVLALPALAVAALVLAFDGTPVFYRQERLGRGGRHFRIHKFRTMRPGAGGRPLTVGDDPRVTRLGAVLRRAKIDEWPQLLDVLGGRMALVGPRPEVPAYAAAFATEEGRHLLGLRPGITDPASLLCRDEARLLAARDDPERFYREVLLPAKIRLSWRYARRATHATDLAVLLETAVGRPRFSRAFLAREGLEEEWRVILGEG